MITCAEGVAKSIVKIVLDVGASRAVSKRIPVMKRHKIDELRFNWDAGHERRDERTLEDRANSLAAFPGRGRGRGRALFSRLDANIYTYIYVWRASVRASRPRDSRGVAPEVNSLE